jgi:multiple antibiotic resistance protein
MTADLEFLLVATASIIAIVNPISTAAVYSVLTEQATPGQQRQVMRTSMQISLVVLIFFALTGQFIFTILGLTLPAFKIAGGILLISFATGMLSAKRELYSPEELENISIVPLAFPLTCGAGTITTVILIASEAEGLVQNVIVIAAILITIAASYIAMAYSNHLFRFIGENELRIIAKFLAIFVLAIAIQFIISGLSGAMPEIIAEVGGCICP